MKRNTPLITLLVGAALGVVILVASMLATPSGAAPASYSAPAASAAPVPSSAAPSTPAPAESSEAPEQSPAAAPSPAPTRTTPTRADFAGRVGGGGGSVAVAVH